MRAAVDLPAPTSPVSRQAPWWGVSNSRRALTCCRQIALSLDLEPAHFRGDLVRQIADAVVRLNQGKRQHPLLICDEAHLLPYPAR